MRRPLHGSLRRRHRATGEEPARDAVPGDRRAQGGRRRAVHHPLVPGATSVSDVAARPGPPPGPGGLPAAGAGGELEFLDRVRVGDDTKRTSRISDVTMKTGSTGALCFVSVEHIITTPRGTAIRERQDIVYRDVSGAAPATPAKAPPPPPIAKHRESHMADAVLLFRYSALTFNGHRIHYDRDYVTKVEGYPALVFHGPMQAALLVEFAAKLHGSAAPKKFSYRGVQPLFEGSEFSVNANDTGTGMELWTANAAGQPTMKATAVW